MLNSKRIKNLTIIAIVLYALCLIWVITLKCNMIQPVVESRYILSKLTLWERIIRSCGHFAKTTRADFLVNTILFLPLGLLLPFLKNRRPYISTALFGFALSLAFEISQILNCIGGFTYIDILANTLGAIIGAIIHFEVKGKIKEKHAEVALAVGIGLAAATFIFGFFNTIKCFDIYISDDLTKYL